MAPRCAAASTPAGQAAENYQAAVREIACQPLGHAQPVRCGMARAHDCDSRLREHIHISARMKDQRRIVDLLQLCGVGGIIRQTTVTRAAATRPSSSWANSIDWPVPSDWAETVWMPVASSPVNDALKMFRTPPKC